MKFKIAKRREFQSPALQYPLQPLDPGPAHPAHPSPGATMWPLIAAFVCLTVALSGGEYSGTMVDGGREVIHTNGRKGQATWGGGTCGLRPHPRPLRAREDTLIASC